MEVEREETLTATVAPTDAASKALTWTSSNPDVATVTDGTVTAVALGTAIITVTTEDDGKTAQCEVTVATFGWVVSTIAGDGKRGLADGAGSAVRFDYPEGIAIDTAGNLYVADFSNHRIRKITEGPAGTFTVSTFAGSGAAGSIKGGYAEGDALTAARFNGPGGRTLDTAGNLYVADFSNHRIRKIDKNGKVSTFAGSGATGSANGGYAEGDALTAARFEQPCGIIPDAAGNLYVADRDNHRIRKIDKNGKVSTFAGSGATGSANGGYAEGDALTAARFDWPMWMTLDTAGNLYVADCNNHRIRKIDKNGKVSTFAGSGATGSANGGYAEGDALTAARFNRPTGITLDAAGNLYVADCNNHRIRKIDKNGKVSTIAGDGTAGFADGPGTAARFNRPDGITVDAAGNLYIADTSNHRIRKLSYRPIK
jgi:sugar lactone lactonase YvrE